MKMKGLFCFLICWVSLFVSTAYAVGEDQLLANEKNTIELFRNFSPKVVYVHRLKTDRNRHSHRRRQVAAGSGSGIIWDQKGHIVTNFHVVKGADHLAISIGKLKVPAKVIGSEPRKDLAVLSIKDPKVLASLKSYVPFGLAKTNELIVGQKTVAIGNPFGLDHSLSVGVISALGRQVPGIGGIKIKDMIQTDASINPGNSGGPLMDSKGQLIGLNTIIFSNSGSSSGVGFAIPADDIGRIVPQIIKKGRVVLAGIGVKWLGPRVTKQLGINKGVLVGKIIPKTPAAQVGLKGIHRDSRGHMHAGDVIIGLNGQDIDNYDAFYNILTTVPVGEKINLTVLRKGKKQQLRVKTIDVAALGV